MCEFFQVCFCVKEQSITAFGVTIAGQSMTGQSILVTAPPAIVACQPPPLSTQRSDDSDGMPKMRMTKLVYTA